MKTIRFKVDKLIRDKIPAKLQAKGIQLFERSMEDAEFIERLHNKLIEESHECFNAQNLEELTEEMGDVLEVIYALAHAKNIDIKAIEEKRLAKQALNGGFDLKIYSPFLESQEDNPALKYYQDRPDQYPRID